MSQNIKHVAKTIDTTTAFSYFWKGLETLVLTILHSEQEMIK